MCGALPPKKTANKKACLFKWMVSKGIHLTFSQIDDDGPPITINISFTSSSKVIFSDSILITRNLKHHSRGTFLSAFLDSALAPTILRDGRKI